MRPRRLTSQQSTAALFDEAVRERAIAVLTLQNHDEWHSFKARFLERDPNQRFFVLDCPVGKPDPPPDLQPGQCVGVSFRHRSRKILFATVAEARGHYLFDDQTSIPAIRYRWPESVTELQRRAYYRTPVPESVTLPVTLWPGGVSARNAAQRDTGRTVAGALVDVSCGGALVRLSELSSSPWPEEETLGVEMQLGDERPPILLNARFRGSRPDQLGQLSLALQFIGLELSVDGRLILQRLANCVQRFHRLSIGSGARDWNRPRRPRE